MKNLFSIIFLFGLISCGSNTDESQKPDQAEAPVQTQVKKAPTKPIAGKPLVSGLQQKTNQVQSGTSTYKAKNEGWLVNLEKAYEESQKTGKPIMANFTGSDWCGWCKRLDKSVFHQPGFEKWADKNVVLLELDFPRRFRLPSDIASQNQGLAQTFGVRGYPTIWLFDLDKDAATGKFNINALGKTGYTKTLAEFQSTMGGYIAKRG